MQRSRNAQIVGQEAGAVRRRPMGAVALALLVGVFLALAGPAQPSRAAPWVDGDVFAGIGDGKYAVFNNSGNLKETISVGSGPYTTGCAFSQTTGDFYGTLFQEGMVVRVAGTDPHGILNTFPTGDTGSESIAFADNGDFYVGHALGSKDIRRFNSAGALQDTFDVATGPIGSDWIDLSTDQKTIFYTSEGVGVQRYDVTSRTQLPPFSTQGTKNFALRLLSPADGSGGMLVAGNTQILLLDENGGLIQSYDAPGEDAWFALNLDPNGTSFWSGGQTSRQFYRFNIATGAIELGPINSTASSLLGGLCVKGEPTGAQRPRKPGPPSVFGRGGLVQAPSNRRCVSRRKFRIRIRERGGIRIETAQLFLNGKKIKVVKRRIFQRKRHTATVNLRGLPKGRFTLKIVVLTTEGDFVRGTRKYHTCTKKRRSRGPPRL
jgi:hypothetical protein